MPFEPIQPEKISHTVVRQIEQLILRGILKPGERLPSERELSERLGVSRPSLREALAELQDGGLLTSKAGSGVFVGDVLGSAFSDTLVRLFSNHDEAVFDYIAFRRDMEEAAHTKRDPSEEAGLDADFHLSIIEASHNVIMLHMMRSMYQLLREGVFYNRQIMFKQRMTRDTLLDQHRAINVALQARDAAGARAAVEAHLGFVEGALFDQDKAERHEAIARKRLDHEVHR